MRALSLIALLFLTPCWPALAQAPLTAAQQQALQAGDRFRECDGCPEMVVSPRTYLRIAVRGRQAQGYRYINAGVRVAREIAR